MYGNATVMKSFLVPRISLGACVQKQAISWVTSEKHSILGGIGGRVFAILLRPPAEIVDIFIHTLLGVGKITIGYPLSFYLGSVQSMHKNEWHLYWTFSKGLEHLFFAIPLHFFELFTAPLFNLIDPEIYAWKDLKEKKEELERKIKEEKEKKENYFNQKIEKQKKTIAYFNEEGLALQIINGDLILQNEILKKQVTEEEKSIEELELMILELKERKKNLKKTLLEVKKFSEEYPERMNLKEKEKENINGKIDSLKREIKEIESLIFNIESQMTEKTERLKNLTLQIEEENLHEG